MILAMLAQATVAPPVYGGMPPRPPLLTVAETRRRLPGWQGRSVRVKGWLAGDCGTAACSIRERRDGRGGAALSIARMPGVEPDLLARRGKPITLLGILSRPDQQRGPGMIGIGRAGELIPITTEE